MKINFIGNTCNNHYAIAKFLRKEGIDAHLYYPPSDVQQRPESEDPELADDRPDWLHPLPDFPRFSRLDHPGADLLKEFQNCDLIHAHGYGLTWAAKTKRPFVWHPYGGDFFDLPLRHWRKLQFPYFRNFRTVLASSAFQSAITQAKKIILAEYDYFWTPGFRLLKKLHQWEKIVRIPLIIDTAQFSPKGDKHQWPDQGLATTLDQFDLVIFHPTRQLFTHAGLRYDGITIDQKSAQTGQYGKGNVMFYRALAKLVHEDNLKIATVIVDKRDPDTPAAKQLVADLGLDQHVFWIPKMTRFELIAWYRAVDLVVDALAEGALGSIPLETMACGTPIMKRFDLESDDEFFLPPRGLYQQLPPVISATSEADVVEKLHWSVKNKQNLRQLGKDSRNWVLTEADGDSLVGRYAQLYREISPQVSS